MQYSLAICKSSDTEEDDYNKRTQSTDQYQTKRQFRLKLPNVQGKTVSKDKRIEELEEHLKWQALQHQNELDRKTFKIEELEKSILNAKEVCKLQSVCKRLYNDGDEVILQRIGDISDRAARRLSDYRG